MNFSETELSIRNRFPVGLVPGAGPATNAPKNDLKKGNAAELTPPVAAALTPRQMQDVLERFQPLPTILNQALTGTRSLHQQVQSLGKMASTPTSALFSAMPAVKPASSFPAGGGSVGPETTGPTVAANANSRVLGPGGGTPPAVQAPVMTGGGALHEKNIPPAAVFVPAPAISTVPFIQAPSLETLQSQTRTSRPLAVPVGGPPTPEQQRAVSFQALQAKLQKAGLRNFLAQAQQAVQLSGAFPNSVPAASGSTPLGRPENGVLPSSAVIPVPTGLASLQAKPDLSQVETVAQMPVNQDNERRPHNIQGTEMSVLTPKNGNGIPANLPQSSTGSVSNNQPAPLANMRHIPRPLPTDVRSHLVQVTTVNLLDLVL